MLQSCRKANRTRAFFCILYNKIISYVCCEFCNYMYTIKLQKIVLIFQVFSYLAPKQTILSDLKMQSVRNNKKTIEAYSLPCSR